MTQQSNSEGVLRALRERYEQMDANGDIAISPAVLAAQAYPDIDPEGVAPILVQWAAVMEMRQLARGICRSRNDEFEERASMQDEMFEQLQPRYPAHRNGEEVYVQREHLTPKEYEYNIARLRSEGAAKLAHADALQAEYEARDARGDFAEAS